MHHPVHWIVLLLAAPLAARAPQDEAPEPELPPKYALRAEGRSTLADGTAGDAILAGLEWLRDRQAKDGRWDADAFMTDAEAGGGDPGTGNPVHDVGVTGLALLAFLADGHTTARGDFAGTVQRGLAWLRSQQQPTNGLLGVVNSNEFVYSHLVGGLALVEAYGLSGDPELRDAAQKAVQYTEWHRNPERAWRYQPRDGDQDTSVTVWAMNLLIAARDFGLEIDRKALLDGDRYLLEMTDPRTGRTGYTDRGGFSARRAGDHDVRFPRERNEPLTAAALLVQLLLESDPDSRPGMTAQIEVVTTHPPRWDPGSGAVDFYAFYHGAMAMRQIGGAAWRRWRITLHDALVPTQRDDGAFAGSWDPVGPWGEDGGRVYATAMAVLALTAEYRYAELKAIVPVPDTATFRSARRAWTESRFESFAGQLDRIEGAHADDSETLAVVAGARAALARRVARAIDTVETLRNSDDYLIVRDTLEIVARQFGRLEPGRMADAVLDGYRKSERVQAEIKAQETFEELVRRYDPAASSSQRRRLIDGLERLVERYPGTRGARSAAALLSALR